MLWQKRRTPEISPNINALQVEWLPSSIFDTHSQFVLSLNSNYLLDVKIVGNRISVSTVGNDGDYKATSFSSSEEFELFVKNQFLCIDRRGKL